LHGIPNETKNHIQPRLLSQPPEYSLSSHDQFKWEQPEFLSGIVGHGKGFPPAQLSNYGPPLQEVKLLDGLMIGCRSQTLLDSHLRFDERFDFDFYDLDFCRQAEGKQLKMGTCAVSVVHESPGNFSESERWHKAYAVYLDKWGS